MLTIDFVSDLMTRGALEYHPTSEGEVTMILNSLKLRFFDSASNRIAEQLDHEAGRPVSKGKQSRYETYLFKIFGPEKKKRLIKYLYTGEMPAEAEYPWA